MNTINIKKLCVGKVLPVTCTLFLTGCNSNVEDNSKEVVETPIVSETEEIDDEKLDINLECAIDDEGLFFEKVSPEEIVYLDDIILTNSERGISTIGTLSLEADLLNNLKYAYLNLEEQKIIDKLKVRELAETTFTSDVVTEYVENHSHTALYIEESDDINWEQLFFVLKNNVSLKRKALEMEKDNAETNEDKEYYKELLEVRDFTDEELRDWINQFHVFLLTTRENYSVDIRRLACLLENYVVGYEHQSLSLYGTFASTTDKKMVYPLFEGFYPDLGKFGHVNYHEFYHLLDSSCADEKKTLGTFWGTGIEFDERYIADLQKDKDDMYFPFGYEFLEEGKAESYSSNLLSEEPFVYYDKQFTINNIELALFLQPGFKRGNIEQAAMLHNPIALIQQFPVLDGLISEEEDWFYTQLEMLESYNIINDYVSLMEFSYEVYGYDSTSPLEIVNERVSILENYADLQLLRNFVWTLSNSKNTERDNLTLEDYYYLMNLFIERIEMQRKIVCLNHSIESLDTDSYLVEKEKILKFFEEYLRDEFDSLELKKIGALEEYNLNSGHLSTAFTSLERTYFYKLYAEMDDYYEWNKEIYYELRDNKTYYLIP